MSRWKSPQAAAKHAERAAKEAEQLRKQKRKGRLMLIAVIEGTRTRLRPKLILILSVLPLAVPPSFGQTSITMLVPGFTVRELPAKLSIINNLAFTSDGRLTALGYDGRVHILLQWIAC